MKFLIVVLIQSLIFQSLISQEITERYENENGFIEFHNENIEINLKLNGGFSVNLMGNGKYKTVQDFLLIKTDFFSGEKSKFVDEEQEGKISLIEISDIHGKRLIGANILCLDKEGEIIDEINSDKNGVATLANDGKVNSLLIRFLGYDDLVIPYKSGMKYNVSLVEGYVSEEEMILLKINKKTEKVLDLTLLNFIDLNDKRSLRYLKKIERKSRKYKYQNQHFERVY